MGQCSFRRAAKFFLKQSGEWYNDHKALEEEEKGKRNKKEKEKHLTMNASLVGFV